MTVSGREIVMFGELVATVTSLAVPWMVIAPVSEFALVTPPEPPSSSLQEITPEPLAVSAPPLALPVQLRELKVTVPPMVSPPVPWMSPVPALSPTYVMAPEALTVKALPVPAVRVPAVSRLPALLTLKTVVLDTWRSIKSPTPALSTAISVLAVLTACSPCASCTKFVESNPSSWLALKA